METDFDTIVIGSGAGGASFAQACAKAGKSVLLVERGQPAPSHLGNTEERANLIDRVPYDDRQVVVDDEAIRLYIGGVVGGSTSVYGGVMLRPSADDFHPGKHYSKELPRELWDWPIDYEQLSPYYDEAEDLFKLAVDHHDEYEPLCRPHKGLRNGALPLAPINERLISVSRNHGLQPFRLPLAIDAEICQRCDSCAGFLCPYGARRSTAQVIEETRAKDRLQLMTNAEVDQLERDPAGKISAVTVRDRATGERHQYRANCYALAAGALGSSAIMLRSQLGGSQVGRNYMMHYSPLAIGLFPRSTGANDTFVKQVGFADYYFGTDDCRSKMGIIQSLPAPGPLMMAKNGLKRVPTWLLQFLRRRMLPMVGIVEDLPNPANRVSLDSSGAIRLQHRFADFDRIRGNALAIAMRKILRRAGALLCPTQSLPSREHVAHQCGTLRFGHDSRYAVVDSDCRVFGHDNLFVVDGSILPTSMGVGPSLTIVANALRVAKVAMATT